MASCLSRSVLGSLRKSSSLPKIGPLRQYKQIQIRTKMTETPLTFLFGYRFMHKFDERSKIIVVDGNLGVGKSSLAAELAEKLGMKHIPECNSRYLDEKFLGPGVEADPKFSGDISLDRFYADPLAKDGHTFRFQMMMYGFRFMQYGDAMVHLLETGQGIVMERSVYSDFVFLEAISDMGWIRKECYDFYQEIKGLSLYRMRHPHAVIYLDASPEVAHQRFVERGEGLYLYQMRHPHLVIYLDALPDMAHQRFVERGKGDEKNVSLEYFQALERAHKKRYLPEMREAGCEVLEYDWKSFGSVDRIVDDIGFMKCEHSQWNHANDTDLDKYYRFLTNGWAMADCMVIPKYLPEMTYGGQQFADLIEEYRIKHNRRYAIGYNPGEYKSVFELMFGRR